LLHPTAGKLPADTESSDGSGVSHLIELGSYLTPQQRRQVINTALSTLKEYSHCSISSQQCVSILASIKSMFDSHDLAVLQQFVIEEFRQRADGHTDMISA